MRVLVESRPIIGNTVSNATDLLPGAGIEQELPGPSGLFLILKNKVK
jgi:hypothetical protein